MNYQQIVFEKIKNTFNDNTDWIEVIEDTLNISKSAVYKRIKGDTMLSMDDLIMLMQKFNFSFDELVLKENNKIGFRFPQQNRKIHNFSDYVEPMKEFVTAAKQVPEIDIQYATNELHFFLYFHDKDLLYFKFYIFAKSVWFLNSYKGKEFNLNDFSEWAVIKDDVDEILDTYNQIPTVEIWNGNVLTNTLNQIKYILHSGLFEEPEQALILCDKLETTIDDISTMAENGRKFRIGNKQKTSNVRFEMYHNEINHTSNILLISSPHMQQIFFAFDNPNYILSDEDGLVKYTVEWFDRVKRNAMPISEAANKNRRSYFRSIKKQIDITREQIHNYIKFEG